MPVAELLHTYATKMLQDDRAFLGCEAANQRGIAERVAEMFQFTSDQRGLQAVDISGRLRSICCGHLRRCGADDVGHHRTTEEVL